MKHNQDWSEIDLEALGADFIPATSFLPNTETTNYDADYTHHVNENGEPVPDLSLIHI